MIAHLLEGIGMLAVFTLPIVALFAITARLRKPEKRNWLKLPLKAIVVSGIEAAVVGFGSSASFLYYAVAGLICAVAYFLIEGPDTLQAKWAIAAAALLAMAFWMGYSL